MPGIPTGEALKKVPNLLNPHGDVANFGGHGSYAKDTYLKYLITNRLDLRLLVPSANLPNFGDTARYEISRHAILTPKLDLNRRSPTRLRRSTNASTLIVSR